jgi:hypothetical protein
MVVQLEERVNAQTTQVGWLCVPKSGARLPELLLKLHVIGSEVAAIRGLRWGV